MQFQLSSGKCDIIASNEVFLFNDSNELTLQINDDDGTRSKIVLRFIQDQSGKRSVDVAPQNDYHLVLSCYNFFDRFGAGLKEPALVGESMGKNVYIIFATKLHSIQPPVRSVQFTLYRERQMN